MECIRSFLHCAEVEDGELTHAHTQAHRNGNAHTPFFNIHTCKTANAHPKTEIPQASTHLDVKQNRYTQTHIDSLASSCLISLRLTIQ